MSKKSPIPVVERREFIKASGLATASLLTAQFSVMAGPFEKMDPSKHLIPADKKLSPQWLAGLTKRNSAETYSDEELKYIGMPVGGIGCGQLYLGGDGRLWHWDIFKSNYKREKHDMRLDAMTMCGHYINPVEFGEEYNYQNGADVQQGFSIRVKSGDTIATRTLDKEGFPGVTFRGEYPVGRVTFADSDFPAEVSLEAFSPFIPLNAKDSALPATVMRYTVTNTSKDAIKVDLGGWLQNSVCPYVKDASLGKRINLVERKESRISIINTISETEAIQKEHGYGSSALTVVQDDGISVRATSALSDAEKLFEELENASAEPVAIPLDELLLGGLSASLELKPEESKVITFIISWYFPYHQKRKSEGAIFTARHYRPWFDSAAQVADYVVDKREALIDGTLLWNKTWYDSSLPHWLLDRSIIPLDCAATQTYHWFDNGRIWAWEGVDCCEGTCTHVFHYAQAMGRIFPELERISREEVDYGIAFNNDNGGVGYRGAAKQLVADDGQAGCILRVYREHQMSPDDAFLKRLWPRVKKSIQYLMVKDPNEDGILTGAQPHTLDAEWTGKISWISSMYLGALAAGEAMALEVGDDDFAEECRRILDEGYKRFVPELFDGEYFIHKPNKELGEHLNTNVGCHIDQVLGQAWAHQVGLGRILPKKETVSALESLWKYNFAPDAGGYALKHREIEMAFRWYAMEGEAGLLMTTFPKGGAKEAIPGDELRSVENPELWTGPGGYFNECMNGFEYQVAAHMVAEGAPGSPLVEKGLAIMKAVHDRYSASKRNPYNEIECSDHYARSMASYGVFVSVCGFEYHGPKGHLAFAPRISPTDFKAAFTAAEGWGSFSQKIEDGQQTACIELCYGQLNLNKLCLAKATQSKATQAKVQIDGVTIDASFEATPHSYILKFPEGLNLLAAQSITVQYV